MLGYVTACVSVDAPGAATLGSCRHKSSPGRLSVASRLPSDVRPGAPPAAATLAVPTAKRRAYHAGVHPQVGSAALGAPYGTLPPPTGSERPGRKYTGTRQLFCCALVPAAAACMCMCVRERRRVAAPSVGGERTVAIYRPRRQPAGALTFLFMSWRAGSTAAARERPPRRGRHRSRQHFLVLCVFGVLRYHRTMAFSRWMRA